MPPRSDIVLWLDLETTGSPSTSLVLEVGMAVTGPGPKFETLSAFNRVIDPGVPILGGMDPHVVNMHTKSGLFRDIEVIGQSPTAVDLAMREWIDTVFGNSTQHVVLAGSGVGHFDRQFIKRDWSWLDQRLAYYVYDVGVFRRFARMVGIEAGIDQDLTRHRALDDVFQHIREARALLEMIKP